MSERKGTSALGWTVIISLTVYLVDYFNLTMSHPKVFKADWLLIVSGAVFFFSFWIFCIRGFVRFLGRAWRHGATNGQ